MKIGKEIRVNKYTNYNIIFGSVNNKDPRAVYISVSAWAEPSSDEHINYSRIIKNLNKQVKQLVFNLLSSDSSYDFIPNRTIVDLDMRESGVKFGKRSFMNCEITLFLDTQNILNSEPMKLKLNTISDTVVNKIFERDEHFKFHMRKR